MCKIPREVGRPPWAALNARGAHHGGTRDKHPPRHHREETRCCARPATGNLFDNPIVWAGAFRRTRVLKTKGELLQPIVFWVDPESGWVLRDSTTIGADSPVMQLLPQTQRRTRRIVSVYSPVALGARVPDSLFVFHPPPDAVLVRAWNQAPMGRALEGKPAPEFSLSDLEGRHWTLSSLRGRAVVLFFWPLVVFPPYDYDGPLRALEKLRRSQPSDRLQPLGVLVGANADVGRADARRLELEFPILLDETSAVGASYHPSLWGFVVIDREGRIRHWLESPSEAELTRAVEDAER